MNRLTLIAFCNRARYLTGGYINVAWHYLNRRIGLGASWSHPGLAAQPVLGLCAQQRPWSDIDYPVGPVLIGQNLINARESVIKQRGDA
jgi:hypothetical protein